jgi:hypothetical protein
MRFLSCSRTSCGQYEVVKEIITGAPPHVVHLMVGDRIEAIGVMNIGKKFSKNRAVCFMRGGMAHWCVSHHTSY